MNFIIAIVGWLLHLFLKGPSSEAVQAAKAASAETDLKSEVKANEMVQNAVAAVAGVARTIDNDNGLRKYESTDPNNRDNK